MNSTIGMTEKLSIPAEEKETVWNKPGRVSGTIEVYTTDIVDMRKYAKLANKYPDAVHVLSDDRYGMTFSFPTKWLKVSPPRVLSEEQKQAARERLLARHAANEN